MNILCIGDVVGKPGREAVVGLLDELRQEFSIDFTIVNAENAAGGAGLTKRIAEDFLKKGADVLTLGDHVWDQKEIEPYLDESARVIRPANFPEGVPGKGWCVQSSASGIKIGVINLLGRVFMRYNVDCPFRMFERIIEEVKKEADIVIVDFHAETTSEKVAFGHFSDGKISGLFGTHTHIQTADEKILSKGTAYITDVGMTGPYDSVIGQKKEIIIERFLKSMPIRFHVAQEDVRLHGIVIEVDESSARALKITRLNRELVKLT